MKIGHEVVESRRLLFFTLLVIASIITLVSIVSYSAAKDDYGMVCLPVNTYPRCVTDDNQMATSGALTIVGFALIGLGLFSFNRLKPTLNSQPILYAFIFVALVLGAYAIYSLLW